MPHKHFLRPVKKKHTNKTMYFECEECCDDFRITRGNYRRIITQRRRFASKMKQGGSLDVSRKAWRGK